MSTPIQKRVSVIIAAYNAHETVERCLESLRAQTYRDFEIILTDSSPGDETARIAERFAEVHLDRSATRLYPHEARNRAATRARGELLVSMDADVYPRADWLEELVKEHDASGQVIVGSLACHGRSLRDLGMHFCKFAKFLPAGVPRCIDTAPTANLLVRRADFECVGTMRGDRFVADVTLGRDLEAIGRQLRFAPRAIVEHHHTASIGKFFAERYLRGAIFGRLRASWMTPRAIALHLAVSILPIRLTRIAALTFRNCARARMTGAFLLTCPLTLAGHAASLAGESVSYAEALLRALARRPMTPNSDDALARTTRWGPR